MSVPDIETYMSPSREISGKSTMEPLRDLLSPPRENWRQRRDSRQRNLDLVETASDDGSDVMNGSVISSMTDRYGFMSETDNSTLPITESRIRLEVLRRRESKWLHMLAHWDNYMLANYKKVRERCRKGIPGSIRGQAWSHLCGAEYEMKKRGVDFKRLCNQPGDQKWVDDIKKDLHRNFPTHEMFGGPYEKIGQTELFRVLKAYTVINPVDGYCQAQAPIAAMLLMNMPSEKAFWCLLNICERYIPGYYSAGMEAIQLDGDILFGLLKKSCPDVYRHLKKQTIEPILYMTEWFLCIFTRTLPWSCVLRIWDMFMCEGVKVLFRVALVIMRYTLTRSVRKKCPSMYETLDALKHLPENVKNEQFLVEEISRLNISEDDMKREHKKQLERRKVKAAANTRTSAANVPNS